MTLLRDRMRPFGAFFTCAAMCLLALSAGLSASRAGGQQLTGTLNGTAYDQSGAVVPGAQVTLKNQASGDVRTSVTDSAGHFVITAVQPGTYSMEVSATGFSSWQENDIVMNQGDNRDVPNIKLQVGQSSTNIQVVAGANAVVPTDTAEISTSINQQMIQDFPLQGRDAGELMKIMPGMALNTGASSGSSSFNDRVVGSNNGPVGAYSSNGTQPYGTMAYMLDGANLVDPGNNGTQIANINQDMVANIKMLTSDYGAEYAKGPVIFQAFSRSGGSQFHGEAYLYTHNATLNSVDAYAKSQGLTNAAQSYYYMGGNVGGPVIFPHFGYNRNRNKLFFWAGYEYMKQQPAGTAVNYNAPTPASLAAISATPSARYQPPQSPPGLISTARSPAMSRQAGQRPVFRRLQSTPTSWAFSSFTPPPTRRPRRATATTTLSMSTRSPRTAGRPRVRLITRSVTTTRSPAPTATRENMTSRRSRSGGPSLGHFLIPPRPPRPPTPLSSSRTIPTSSARRPPTSSSSPGLTSSTRIP